MFDTAKNGSVKKSSVIPFDGQELKITVIAQDKDGKEVVRREGTTLLGALYTPEEGEEGDWMAHGMFMGNTSILSAFMLFDAVKATIRSFVTCISEQNVEEEAKECEADSSKTIH